MNSAISEARLELSLSALGRDRDCRVERLSLVARIRSLSATPLVAFRFTPRRGCTRSHDFNEGAHGLLKNLCADARPFADGINSSEDMIL